MRRSVPDVRANPRRGDGNRARRSAQRRGRAVAGQDPLGAGEVGGPDDDQLGSFALGGHAQRVGWGAVGDGPRTARRAHTGQLGLHPDQDVAAEQQPGRARVDGDELASTRERCDARGPAPSCVHLA